jgi:membrane-bound ClpP family serine protease
MFSRDAQRSAFWRSALRCASRLNVHSVKSARPDSEERTGGPFDSPWLSSLQSRRFTVFRRESTMPSKSVPDLTFRPWLVLLTLLLASGAARADSTSGLVVDVPSGRIAEVAGTLMTAVEGPLKAFEARRKEAGGNPAAVFKVVFNFNPGDQANRSDSFGACYELASAIQRLQEKGVRSVAYVRGEVSRHSVMPVLACSEIVLSRVPLATLGPVGSADRPLKDVEKLQYDALAKGRFPLVVIRKLYDPDAEVIQVQAGVGGDRYQDGRDRPRPQGTVVEGFGPGSRAAYTFDKAKQFGLIQAEPRNTLDEVLEAYGLNQAAARRQMPANPVVCKTVLAGAVNGEAREKMQRRLKAAREMKATLLIVELACGEGDVANARDIAEQLMALSSLDEPIYTIAYIRPQARNLATMLAIACDRIVMHPRAHLGEFEGYLQSNPTRLDPLRTALEEVARKKGFPEVIARGMLDRALSIRWVKRIKGEGEKRFLDDATFTRENTPQQVWETLETIKPAKETDRNQFLTLDAPTAQRLGLAESQQDSSDKIAESTGVSPGSVRSLDGDLLERIADFLRDPWTSYVLLMVAMIGLILEIKIPGVALPGVVSAVCFVLYFWSHSQFNGEIVWLALLLFVLGMALIALEIFVLPGFAVCGIVGVLCILAALGLIGVGQIPRSMEDWTNFGNQLGYLLLGMFLAIISAVLIVRYLPHLPFVNQLMLRPAEGAEETAEGAVPEEEAQELLGAIGVAATPLRPSGKMQIGDRFLDVVAEGGYILPGTRVQIVEIEGNRIVVKEI